MHKTLQLNVEQVKLLGMSADRRFYYADIYAMNEGACNNGWQFLNLAELGQGFKGTPILCTYDNGRIGGGHDFEVKINPKTGEQYRSFVRGDAERCVGYCLEDGNIRMEEIEGKNWLVVPIKLFRTYNHELVEDVIARSFKGVSVEIDVDMKTMQKDGDVEVYDNWLALGITILGEGVKPAFDGARIKALSESDEYKETLRVASEMKPFDDADNPLNYNKKNKGVRILNKALRIKQLATKFPDATIFDISADGKAVAMLQGDTPKMYMFGDNDGEIVVSENFSVLGLQAVGKTLDGTDIVFCADELTMKADADSATLTAELETANSKVKELSEKIDAMEKAETERRTNEIVKALEAKKVTDDSLYCENERVDTDAYTALLESAKSGAFTSMVDKDGKFVGVESVEKEFLALRGAKTESLTLAKKQKEQEKKKPLSLSYILDPASHHESGSTDLDALNNELEAEFSN